MALHLRERRSLSLAVLRGLRDGSPTGPARARLGLAVVLSIILVAIVLDDSGHLREPVGLITSLPLGDKVCHFGMFGLLGFFVARVFPAPSVPGTGGRVPAFVALAFLLTALEELSQAWIPWRHCDPFDLLADGAGMALFTWLAVRDRPAALPVAQPAASTPPTGETCG